CTPLFRSGVPQSVLEVAVQGDELLIAGIRDSLPLDTAAIFTERPVGPFQRTIRLPSPVDPEQATAHLHSGVLTITLPKQQIGRASCRERGQDAGVGGSGTDE